METSCAQNKNVADAFIILLELINIDKIFKQKKNGRNSTAVIISNENANVNEKRNPKC